ncbi:MAG TPA: 5'-3' exonuclease H3TH domain-containing protein, partial [Nitrospiraceae bacterium]
MSTDDAPRPVLYLIDASGYIYRAFFALPPLNNSKGLQTNAVYGFTTMLLKILREKKPAGLVVAFDEKGATLRHQEFKEYKAQRPPMPEGMSAQLPYIHRIVDALNIASVRQAGYEADDLIGTLARKAEQAGYDVVIVTSDKDMFQLLTVHVRIYDPVKDKWSGEAECHERFGVEPVRVIEIMGLMGDSTDNIPGVRGIGEKTAIKLITQFGTIEELLRRVDEVTPPRTKALLIEQAENARLSRKLATIDVDSPVQFDPGSFHAKTPHIDQLTTLLSELEFTTLLRSFQPVSRPSESKGIQADVVADEPSAQQFVKALPKNGPLGIYCLCSGGPGMQATVLGIGLSTGERPVFVPLNVREPMRAITMLLQDPLRTKVVHDLKTTSLAFQRIGLTLAGPYLDTMVADYLLNPNRRDHQLDTIARDVLGHGLTTEQEPPAPQSLFQEATASGEEAAQTALILARVAPVLTHRLSEQGSLKLFTEIEMPLVEVL